MTTHSSQADSGRGMSITAVADEGGLDVSTVRVETKAGAFSYTCLPGETLLAAGLSAGFDLPYECATGTCGSCHARVMEGVVDPGWAEAPAYRKLRREKGDVLMCQARSSGSCLLRVPSKLAQPATQVARSLARTGRVTSVRPLTKDVTHFEVALSEPVSFAAGQFMTLQHASLVGRRAYSMVNYGQDLDRLTFVVKRKPDGEFSRLLFDGEFLGAEVDIFGPLGRATFRPEEGRDVVCIAGGSGIAGMMAMLEHATQLRYFDQRKGFVFFGVRTLEDAFYLQEFADHVALASGGLEVTIAISHETDIPASHPEFRGIALATGMVHEVVSRVMKGRWGDPTCFIAGPQPMVDAAIRVLITEAKIGSDRIRFDKFS